jgi:hypothetical protein
MRTLSVIFACTSIAALASACDPGSVDGGSTDELLCSAPLTITGTFAVGDPQPAEVSGCWPIGTWTFSMTVGEHDCGAAPTPLAEYQIKVERDLTAEDPDFTWNYTYVTDPGDTTAHIGVTSGGGGLCEAELLVYANSGKTVWNLHPALQAGGTINGIGDYEEHSLNQIPQGGN